MIRLENKDFGTIVKNILGESLLTKAIKKHSEKELPQDDTEMANWVRKNEDPLIENLARATGAYSMPREEFIKQQ